MAWFNSTRISIDWGFVGAASMISREPSRASVAPMVRGWTYSAGPSPSIMDTYSTFPWPALCAEIDKLKIQLHEGTVIELLKVAAMGAIDTDRTGLSYPATSGGTKHMKSQMNLAEMHGNRNSA